MTSVVLDLEAVADGTGTPWASDDFASPPHWRIVCAGTLLWDRGPVSLTVLAEPEDTMLRDLAGFFDNRTPIVTWGGRRYDLPVIAARCFALGIPLASYYARPSAEADYHDRYRSGVNIDLCDRMAEHGGAQHASLNDTARSMGLPGKLDVAGGDVARMMGEGKLREVCAYCACDVLTTTFVWLRWLLLTGRYTLEHYRAASLALWRFAEGDERVAPVVAAADRGRVLLEGT